MEACCGIDWIRDQNCSAGCGCESGEIRKIPHYTKEHPYGRNVTEKYKKPKIVYMLEVGKERAISFVPSLGYLHH